MFIELIWQNKGIFINGKRLSHLRFADDITLRARDQDELQNMIEELNKKSEQKGLKINSPKTKYPTNDIHQNQHTITIHNGPVEKVKSYIYLGQKIKITRNNITADLLRRISMVSIWENARCLQIRHTNRK